MLMIMTNHPLFGNSIAAMGISSERKTSLFFFIRNPVIAFYCVFEKWNRNLQSLAMDDSELYLSSIAKILSLTLSLVALTWRLLLIGIHF